MDIKDLPGIGKLAETLASVFGTLSQPYFTRKNAEAKAYAIKLLAEARAYEIKTLTGAVTESGLESKAGEYTDNELSLSFTEGENKQNQPLLPERTASRREYQEQIEQANIEEITSIAAEELISETEVSPEPVDDDWTKRFFSMAKDISTEDMQKLWGKILAGEIKQPKSFSLRTLETLRNFSKQDAETFQKFAALALRNQDGAFISFDDLNYLTREFGISYRDIMSLQEIGIIGTSLQTQRSYPIAPENSVGFIYGNKVIVAKDLTPGETTPNHPVLLFTRVGSELLKLIEITPDPKYIKHFALTLKKYNISHNIVCADLKSVHGDKIIYDDADEILIE